MMNGHLPPPTVRDVLLSPVGDLTVVVFCALAALLYLFGVYRLWRRGIRWPRRRTALWLSGIFTIYLVSGGGFAHYAMVLFSAHMVQHMAINMYAPIMLVLGAPVTLALRALPANRNPRSPRKLLVRLLHSRFLAFVGSMPIAVVLFAFSLFGLYFTQLLSLLMSSPTGHMAMQAHFLVTGYLFFWTLIGADPGPRRPSVEIRLASILPVGAVHAFFAVMVAFSQNLLGEPYFSAVRPAWVSLSEQQAAAGGIAGGMAEVPMIATAAVLLLSWFKALDRKAPATPSTLLVDNDVPLSLSPLKGPAVEPRQHSAPNLSRLGRVMSCSISATSSSCRAHRLDAYVDAREEASDVCDANPGPGGLCFTAMADAQDQWRRCSSGRTSFPACPGSGPSGHWQVSLHL
jgi:putative membrane protein